MPKIVRSKSLKPQSPSPETPPNGPMLTVRQAGAKIGYSPQTFYNAFVSGAGVLSQLPKYRYGRTYRFAASDIEAFLAAHRVEPVAR